MARVLLSSLSHAEILSHNGRDRDGMLSALRALVAEISAAHWAEGRAWYAATLATVAAMAATTGHTVAQCAVVVAHLSPKTLWDLNVKRAHVVLSTGSGQFLNAGRAVASLSAPDPLATLPAGKKTDNFARNILGDASRVTLDVWMHRALAVTQAECDRTGMYAALADIVTTVATESGVTPAELQAAVWCHIRGTGA